MKWNTKDDVVKIGGKIWGYWKQNSLEKGAWALDYESCFMNVKEFILYFAGDSESQKLCCLQNWLVGHCDFLHKLCLTAQGVTLN